MMDLSFTEHSYKKDETTGIEHIQKSVGAITVCLDDKDANHTLFIRFRDEGMDSRYPNYQSVIPPKFNYFMECNRLQLLKSVNRMIQFTCVSGLTALNLSPDKMTISANDSDFGIGANEVLPCQFKSPLLSFPEMKIGLKCSIVASILKRITSERVCFSFIDSTQACIIQPKPQPEVEDLKFLIMPMLTND